MRIQIIVKYLGGNIWAALKLLKISIYSANKYCLDCLKFVTCMIVSELTTFSVSFLDMVTS